MFEDKSELKVGIFDSPRLLAETPESLPSRK